MKLSRQLIAGLVFGIALAFTAGCSTQETATESDFGKSVHSMIQAQTMNPMNAMLPDPEAVDHGNGERLDNVMEVYKTDVSTPPVTQKPGL